MIRGKGRYWNIRLFIIMKINIVKFKKFKKGTSMPILPQLLRAGVAEPWIRKAMVVQHPA